MRKMLLTTLLAMLLGSPAALAFLKANREDVSIKDGKFNPASVSINANDSVQWTNDDNQDHQITSDDGSFKSEKLKKGETYTKRFADAGTFSYSCTALHPREKGKVVVKKAK